VASTLGTQIVKAQSTILAADTVGNTTTATTFGTSWTMPANWMNVGRCLQVTARGYYSTAAALAGNMTMDLMGGTWVLASTGAQALTVGLGGDGWEMKADVICGTTGPAGSVLAQGLCLFETASITANPVFMVNTTGISLDTTVAQTIVPRVTWSATGNTITMGTYVCSVGGLQ